MSCRRIDIGPNSTVWSCTRGRASSAPVCSQCREHVSTTSCGFQLRGEKAGQVCGRVLCTRCTSPKGGVSLCPPHAKMIG